MSVRYFTLVHNDMMPHVRIPDCVEGLRLLREIGPICDWTLVEFEDDGASADLEGFLVTPALSEELMGVTSDGEIMRRVYISMRRREGVATDGPRLGERDHL